jgi:hypothetical protein
VGVPTWVTMALLVLLLGAAFVLPPLAEWVINGRLDYAVVACGGPLGLGMALLRRHRRERERC